VYKQQSYEIMVYTPEVSLLLADMRLGLVEMNFGLLIVQF
jgi:hypothetical protein